MINRISANAGYTWWTRPVFIRSGGDTYFTGLSEQRKWRAFQNNASQTFSELGDCPELDDHNAPSVLVRPGKPKLAFTVRHGKSKIVNYWRADSGMDFQDRANLTHPSSVSYTQVIDHQDEVLVLSRVGLGQWRYLRSSDWGQTWSGSQPFLTRPAGGVGQFYMTTAPTNTAGVWDVAAYGHPVNSDLDSIHWGQIDLTTNQLVGVGTLGNQFSVTDLETAVPATPEAKYRLLNIGRMHGHPTVVYAIIPNDGSAIRYAARHRANDQWTAETPLGLAGAVFYETSRYVGGIAIQDNAFYVSREHGGDWTISKIAVAEDLSPGFEAVLARDTVPLVRPYAVEGGTSVVWQKLKTYNHYVDYFIDYWEYTP